MSDLSNQQRLELISDMIREAKSFVAHRGSSQVLLWGWVIALTNLSHFILQQVGYHAPYVVWLSVFPTAFYSIYLGRKMKGHGVRSHIDQLYGQVWIAVAVVIVITLLLMSDVAFYHNPIIIATSGAGMYITGRLLKFSPVLYGSFVLWLAALVEWQINVEWHYLISSIAIFVGYLIPGYLLKKSERV